MPSAPLKLQHHEGGAGLDPPTHPPSIAQPPPPNHHHLTGALGRPTRPEPATRTPTARQAPHGHGLSGPPTRCTVPWHWSTAVARSVNAATKRIGPAESVAAPMRLRPLSQAIDYQSWGERGVGVCHAQRWSSWASCTWQRGGGRGRTTTTTRGRVEHLGLTHTETRRGM